MEYRLNQIAQIFHLPLLTAGQDRMIDSILTDSRKLTRPDTALFFALEGPRRQGQLFIAELYKKGVRSFVVSQPMDAAAYPEAGFLVVADTLKALQLLARWHRQQFAAEVIGITGSNGKTIVKEWLFQLLQSEFNIVRSPKSYNSQLGVALSLWQMEPQNNLALFEAGISKPGEMNALQAMIQPSLGILTNLGAAHSEGFTSDDQKLQEKLLLFTSVRMLIIPGDDDRIFQQVSLAGIPVYRWGRKPSNDLQVLKMDREGLHTRIQVRKKDDTFSFEIPFTDEASIDNALSCVAMLLYLGKDAEFIQAGMPHLQAVSMRLEFKQGINHCTIINDSYSADFSALSIALDFLQQQARGKKKTVVLSDFPKNRESDRQVYQAVLALLNQYGVNRFIGIGEKMPSVMPGLLPKDHSMEVQFYLNTQDFVQQFHATAFKEEYILVKGARKFEFERIVGLLEQKVHQTILEINLDAVAANLKTIQHRLRPGVKLMTMVKAFGYGSGAAEIASVAQFHKADWLGVAYADEGVELRRAGISLPIMVLNVEANAFETITENHLEPDLYSFELLQGFETHLKNAGLKQYPVHIELETGMNRSGFEVKAVPELLERLQGQDFCKVQSVFSHLAASEDSVEDAFTLHQFQLFEAAATEFQQGLGYPIIKHIANTAAIFRFPELQLDMVRLGIGLYGISGNPKVPLETVATLKTTISQIKRIKKGETVSYNRRGIAQQDSTIATIRIGYADGYSRRLGNGVGKVWIGGRLAPIMGTVCMDMTMVDITEIPNVQAGDEVILFGAPLPVQELAGWMDTIPYEIMTGISQRVKRVYFGEG